MRLQTIIIPLFAAAALTSGCTSTASRDDGRYAQSSVRSSQDRSIGIVDSIDSRRSESDDSNLNGTVIGGVVGAIAGHQVGEGRTRKAATVAGAVGGAVVGRKIDQAHGGEDVYVIRVRFNDDSYRTVTQNNLDGLRVGDRVRVDSDGIRPY